MADMKILVRKYSKKYGGKRVEKGLKCVCAGVGVCVCV